MDQVFQIFDEKVEELARLSRPKIAFGLNSPDEKVLESLEKGKKYADIVLVGPEAIKNISGFEKVISQNPEAKLASMLANDEIDGIIRGTVDDFKTFEAYQKLTGEKDTFGPGLMESPLGHHFFIGVVSNIEGWEKEERYEYAKKIAQFMKEWDFEPKIAVLTGRRHDTYPIKKDLKDKVNAILNQTYEDAEWIVKKLEEDGYEAKNWAIDLNPAIESGFNLIIPPNGMVGNQIFRTVLFCGGKFLFGTYIGLSHPYEQNSRTEKDFDYHIKWLSAVINKREKA
jgi:predicted methyltransferase MtxX (methanogen marker protein 4)